MRSGIRREKGRSVEQRDISIFETNRVHHDVGVPIGIGESIPLDIDLSGAVGASALGNILIIKIEVLDCDE